jgi:hypothetical protein
MKPLQTIAGAGDNAESVIAHLIGIANYAFADLDFSYRDTVISYEQSGTMHLQGPKLICKATLIFEADSQEEMKKFADKMYSDPQLRDLLPRGPMHSVPRS